MEANEHNKPTKKTVTQARTHGQTDGCHRGGEENEEEGSSQRTWTACGVDTGKGAGTGWRRTKGRKWGTSAIMSTIKPKLKTKGPIIIAGFPPFGAMQYFQQTPDMPH